MDVTYYVCGKCGRTMQPDDNDKEFWIIAQRLGKPEGHLIIRCPEHTTDYARRLAGLKQQYYHQQDSRIFKSSELDASATGWIANLSAGTVNNPDCYFHFTLKREATDFLRMVDEGMSTDEASYHAAGWKAEQ